MTIILNLPMNLINCTSKTDSNRKKPICINNQTAGTCLALTAHLSDTFWTRLKGLIRKKSLPLGSGMVLIPCQSIHTCFMRFNIDLIFVNRENLVCYLIENVPPYRTTSIIRDAYYVIELPIGTIRITQTQVGDQIVFTQ
jgi:hypothetical protein